MVQMHHCRRPPPERMMNLRNVWVERFMYRNHQGKSRIQDVARQARVSMATASRALNNLSSVDVHLSNRVWEAASALNYQPNAHAKALAEGSSKLIGLLVSEELGNLLPSLLSTFESLAARSGHSVLIGFVEPGGPRLNRCVMRMLAQNVEGIAVMLPPEQDLAASLRASGSTAMVSLDQGAVDLKSTVLRVNYRTGMREAIQHLAALGHRKMLLLTRPGQSHCSHEMLTAFRVSMAEIGLSHDQDAMLETELIDEAGAEAFRARMSRRDTPTAVIAASAVTAAAVISLGGEVGLRVPQDLSVVGFGSMRTDSPNSATLTSIELSATELARAALRALGIGPETMPLPSLDHAEMLTRLVVRQSTDFASAWSRTSRP
jgi:LacI family transcriptional regulator